MYPSKEECDRIIFLSLAVNNLFAKEHSATKNIIVGSRIEGRAEKLTSFKLQHK